MLKNIVGAIVLILSFNAFAALQYKSIYELPVWNGNPYTPLAISRISKNKSSPNPLDAKFILGIQDREFYNNNTITNMLESQAKPLYLFGNWFIYSEKSKTTCNGTQIVLRSASGELRGLTMKPQNINIFDKFVDCYIVKKYDRVNRVIYLTNEVIAFDSTVGLFFFNLKTGSFYKDFLVYPKDYNPVLYNTQDGDFLIETVEEGTPMRKYKDGYDPKIGIRALRLDGKKIPGSVSQQDLNTIKKKRGI